MPISDDIRQLRFDLDLTISMVAERSGISVPTVRSVESGTGSIGSMLGVIEALGGSLTWPDRQTNDTLGASLSACRRHAGLSQRTLAAMIGVTQPTVVAMERESRGRMETLGRYLRSLNIEPTLVERNAPIKQKARRLVPPTNRPENDLVYTPHELAKQIIDHFPVSGVVLDPCRGDGAFFDQYPAHVDAQWCEITQGRDFMNWQAPVDWVGPTNPPWSKFRSFLVHGMQIAENIVYVAAFNHYGTKARQADIREYGFGKRSILFVPTPLEFPPSGLQLCAVWLQRGWMGPCEINNIHDV